MKLTKYVCLAALSIAALGVTGQATNAEDRNDMRRVSDALERIVDRLDDQHHRLDQQQRQQDEMQEKLEILLTKRAKGNDNQNARGHKGHEAHHGKGHPAKSGSSKCGCQACKAKAAKHPGGNKGYGSSKGRVTGPYSPQLFYDGLKHAADELNKKHVQKLTRELIQEVNHGGTTKTTTSHSHYAPASCNACTTSKPCNSCATGTVIHSVRPYSPVCQ